MPHKHKRKRDDDVSNFDLPPSSHAKPLAAFNKASIFTKTEEDSSNKRRKANSTKAKKSQDDTPKAFTRLMAWQATGKKPNGLDDGNTSKSAKKKAKQPQSDTTKPGSTTKNTNTNTTSTTSTKPNPTAPKPNPTQPATTTPKILPGETLANFSLRVDQTLPLTGMTRSTTGNLPDDLKAQLKKAQRTTKHNKRLQKMQADWRLTEAKLRDQEEEDEDEREDTKEEETLLWSSVRAARDSRKGKKKRAGNNLKGNNPADDDPWKDLEKRRREETKQKNLQDVVQAPPVLKKVKSKFKLTAADLDHLDGKPGNGDGDVMVDVSNVPNAVGSLRRREELKQTRNAVIEGYRNMRGKKRGVGERLNLSKTIMT